MSSLPNLFRSQGDKPTPDQDAILNQHPRTDPCPLNSRRWRVTGSSEAEWAYPIYLVADTGAASLPAGWNAAVGGAGDAFLDEMIAKPEMGEAVYFGSLLHASALWTSRQLSPAFARGSTAAGSFSTSYECLFRQLGDVLAGDEARLTTAGLRVHMPLVILAVGTPPAQNESWAASWHRLVVDEEVEPIGGDVPRAMVVPVCVEPAAHAACQGLVYPQASSRAYSASDVSTLRDLLLKILTHAAQQLAALPATDGEPVLPDQNVVAGLGFVIGQARGSGAAPAQLPPRPRTRPEDGWHA